MKAEYRYLDGVRTIDLPPGSKIIRPNDVPPHDGRKEILRALEHPLNSPTLSEFLRGRKRVLLIVNDGTRPTPTSAVIEEILPLLRNKELTVMVATGVHRGANEEEKHRILGSSYEVLSSCLVSHDARSDKDMVRLGKSRNGTELEVNKAVTENDCIIVIGSVEPHYFAGFTGGRKAIMPGVASYRSIEMNHRLALSDKARALNLEGNPVHEDMVDALSLLAGIPIFSIMTVMDRLHRVYRATSGDIVSSFDAAIKSAEEVFCVPLATQYDIVVTVADPPMDLDLYQSQKALDNAKLAVKKGGTIIWVASCREGCGEKAFYDLLSSSASPEGALETISKGYVLGYHKAAKMVEAMMKARVFSVSELPPESWKRIFVEPFPSLDQALEEALRLKPDASVLLMNDGGVTVPKVEPMETA